MNHWHRGKERLKPKNQCLGNPLMGKQASVACRASSKAKGKKLKETKGITQIGLRQKWNLLFFLTEYSSNSMRFKQGCIHSSNINQRMKMYHLPSLYFLLFFLEQALRRSGFPFPHDTSQGHLVALCYSLTPRERPERRKRRMLLTPKIISFSQLL